MSKELEALKRIRQETCPATYNQDFDKNECCDIIEQALIQAEKDKAELKRLDIILKLVGNENSVHFGYNGKEIVAITSNRFEKIDKGGC